MRIVFALVVAFVMMSSCATKKEVGIQIYSVRQCFNNIEAALDSLSAIGYTTIETLNGGGDPKCFGYSADEFKALCDSRSLTISSTHGAVNFDRTNEVATIEKWRALFSSLKTMGAKYCVIPGYNFGSTLEQVKATCDHLNRVGEIAWEYDLKLGYHNHKGDFDKVEGETILDYVIANTDADKLFIELDVCEHNMGEANPMDYLVAYPERIQVLHLKDDGVLGASGKVDFDALLQRFAANGWCDTYVEYELPFNLGDDAAQNEKNMRQLWQGVRECWQWMQNNEWIK